ncbi:hypothetical protein VC83_03160 [Pseudogymnoascus destructans]|uniref:Uncharacterized protein n=2 Tax=Pseudogymnoascus destructans TaxID=655981 RepID=L8G8I9_PSED2|nr:uncharacterized protein VC83_03160 [Pseudogymnoascus destructans]ELR09407.1 hypothetical protein GMDG_03971 [Pseudogymnoascus destructans 20631-21]OAF60019.1 hypothetical protein VC83_03160 [Pseudogymnoascus destructans]
MTQNAGQHTWHSAEHRLHYTRPAARHNDAAAGAAASDGVVGQWKDRPPNPRRSSRCVVLGSGGGDSGIRRWVIGAGSGQNAGRVLLPVVVPRPTAPPTCVQWTLHHPKTGTIGHWSPTPSVRKHDDTDNLGSKGARNGES